MPKKAQKKKQAKAPAKPAEPRVKDFLDLIAPTAVKFNTDHAICGGAYRCTLALRSYPTTTEELALLRHLGEKSGVTLTSRSSTAPCSSSCPHGTRRACAPCGTR